MVRVVTASQGLPKAHTYLPGYLHTSFYFEVTGCRWWVGISPVPFYLQIQTGGERTQFDIMLQGDSGPLINLCVGAPGEEALKRSASVFKQGAEHALVSLGIGS